MAARVTAFVVFAIVAVTFVAGLIVGAQRADENGPVDLIVYNARVYTGTPDQEFAEAIAIRGNRIVRVGSNREIKRLMRRATTVIDAHGGTVTAGFHDGSVNLRAAGFAIEQAAALRADAAAGAGTPGVAEQRAPAGSSASAAADPLRAGKTTARQAAIDQADATAASVADGSAGEHVDTLDAIRRAIGEANSVGVTSVDITARTPDDLLPYDTLLRTRELTARVTAALAADWPLDDAGFARLDATRKRYEGVPFFKVEGVRLTVSDGLDESLSASAGVGTRGHARAAQARAGQRRLATAGIGAHGASRVSAHGAAVAVAPAGRAAGSRHTLAKGAPVPLADEQLVTDLSRTIAGLEQRGWQVILQAADAGDADLAIDAVEAMTRMPASAGVSGGGGSGDLSAAGQADRSDRKSTSAATAEDASDDAADKGATEKKDPEKNEPETKDAGKDDTENETEKGEKKVHRVRLELGSGVDDATVARLTKLGIIASLQKPAVSPRQLALAASSTPASPDAADADPRSSAASRSAAAMGTSGGTVGADASARAGEGPSAAAGANAGPNGGPNAGTGRDGDAVDATAASNASTATRTGASAGVTDATGASADAAVSARAALGEDSAPSPEPWPYANLLAGAAPFLFYSGWPAAPIDPRFTLSAVLFDGLLAMTDDDAPVPGQSRAPREEAARAASNRETLSKRLARVIDAYTRFAALASEDEDRQGTIAKEMLADLVIFSADLFTLPPEKLLDAEVTTTIFDGKVVYTRQPELIPVSDSQ